MNAALDITVNPSSAEITARIATERDRLQTEVELATHLDAQRLQPLEAGDDAALTAIEVKIAACLGRQARITERIGLLQKRHEEAVATEQGASLDALANESRRARAIGEQLLAEYAKHAAALAPIFAKLQLIDILIAANDQTLIAAKRDIVGSPNDLRLRTENGWCMPTKPLYEVVLLPHAIKESTPFWDVDRGERFRIPGYQPTDHDRQLQATQDDAVAALKAELREAPRASNKATRQKPE